MVLAIFCAVFLIAFVTLALLFAMSRKTVSIQIILCMSQCMWLNVSQKVVLPRFYTSLADIKVATKSTTGAFSNIYVKSC